MVVLVLQAAVTTLVATAAPVTVAEQAITEAVPLVVWNRTLTVFRFTFRGSTPAERAVSAKDRIERLLFSAEPDWIVESSDITLGPDRGKTILIDGRIAFNIFEADLDPESGESLQGATDQAVARVRELVTAHLQQRQLPVLVRGIAFSAAATLLYAFLLWLMVRVRAYGLSQLHRKVNEARRWMVIAGYDLRPHLVSIEVNVARGGTFLVGAFLSYVWLTFVLSKFHYTHPWAGQLGAYLLGLGKKLGIGFVGTIPGLFTVLVIIWLTQIISRLISSFIIQVEQKKLNVGWLQPETAQATRRIVTVLVWIFALTVAYPYIPGSNSAAFKGISVFVGLMISLGSAGVVGQIISGLVAVYSQALKPGDYVRVGDHEGVATNMGTLSIKLITRKYEEITIPNAVLVGMTVVNYTRAAGGSGAIVSTGVTIGYDAPWRQVHAMLLQAAERTGRIKREPAPYVYQKALSDFYVDYQLLFHVDQPQDRMDSLSELHGHIQDVFNEHGVQIMSPHFMNQPDDKVWVPPNDWYTPPASAPDAS